jgi:hypothetical protein
MLAALARRTGDDARRPRQRAELDALLAAANVEHEVKAHNPHRPTGRTPLPEHRRIQCTKDVGLAKVVREGEQPI